VIDSHKQAQITAALTKWTVEARASVVEVSVDMWGGFSQVVKNVFPNARIVYDRFHVMKILNEELNKIRKQCHLVLSKLNIKTIKYLILKNKDNLTKEEKQNLAYVLSHSKKLRLAYDLKEEFRGIYEMKQTPANAKLLLEQWMNKSHQLFHQSVQTIKNHIDGICNYFEHRTTSGVMEGINNKIKVIKRQAYGFTNFQHLRMRLMACFSH